MPDRAHRPVHGRHFPSRYEDVRAIAYDTEHFSSRRVGSAKRANPFRRRRRSPPIRPSIGRPSRFCCPRFTPETIGRHEAHTRDICRKLLTG